MLSHTKSFQIQSFFISVWEVERENTLLAFHRYLEANASAWQWAQEEIDLVKHMGVPDHLIKRYWMMKQFSGGL